MVNFEEANRSGGETCEVSAMRVGVTMTLERRPACSRPSRRFADFRLLTGVLRWGSGEAARRSYADRERGSRGGDMRAGGFATKDGRAGEAFDESPAPAIGKPQ